MANAGKSTTWTYKYWVARSGLRLAEHQAPCEVQCHQNYNPCTEEQCKLAYIHALKQHSKTLITTIKNHSDAVILRKRLKAYGLDAHAAILKDALDMLTKLENDINLLQ